MSRRATTVVLLSWMLIAKTLASAEAEGGRNPSTPPELSALEFLIGEWDLTTSFARPDGSRRQAKARLEARFAMGGMGISVEETHAYGDGTFVSAVLYTVHSKTRRIVGSSNNTLGNRKLYEVTVEEDQIHMIQSGELFGGRGGFNKHVLFNLSPNRYEMRLDACPEDGKNCNEGSYSYVAERSGTPPAASPPPAAAVPSRQPRPLDLAKSYVERYVAQDLAGCAEMLADDAVFQDSAMVLNGRAEIMEGLGQTFESLTIDSFEIGRWIESGTRLVAADGVVRFHQNGGFAGYPDTVLRFEISMVVVLEMAAGRVVRHLDVLDLPGYMRQLKSQMP